MCLGGFFCKRLPFEPVGLSRPLLPVWMGIIWSVEVLIEERWICSSLKQGHSFSRALGHQYFWFLGLKTWTGTYTIIYLLHLPTPFPSLWTANHETSWPLQLHASIYIHHTYIQSINSASLVAQMVKNLPIMQETQVRSLGQKDPLEKGMATQSNILAQRIPQTEEPGGLQSMGSQRVKMTEQLTIFTFFFTSSKAKIAID